MRYHCNKQTHFPSFTDEVRRAGEGLLHPTPYQLDATEPRLREFPVGQVGRLQRHGSPGRPGWRPFLLQHTRTT